MTSGSSQMVFPMEVLVLSKPAWEVRAGLPQLPKTGFTGLTPEPPKGRLTAWESPIELLKRRFLGSPDGDRLSGPGGGLWETALGGLGAQLGLGLLTWPSWEAGTPQGGKT